MDDKQAMLQMRAVAIQFLRALEDDLIARGLIAQHDRACITRQERRAALGLAVSIQNTSEG